MNNSLTLLLLVSVASFQYVYTAHIDAELGKKVDSAIAKCKENTALSEETIIELANIGGKLNTQEEKCFAGCILEEIGLIKDNTYNWELHQSMNKRKHIKHQIDNCKTIVNDDRCQLAYEIITCINKKTNEQGQHTSSEESEN